MHFICQWRETNLNHLLASNLGLWPKPSSAGRLISWPQLLVQQWVSPHMSQWESYLDFFFFWTYVKNRIIFSGNITNLIACRGHSWQQKKTHFWKWRPLKDESREDLLRYKLCAFEYQYSLNQIYPGIFSCVSFHNWNVLKMFSIIVIWDKNL